MSNESSFPATTLAKALAVNQYQPAYGTFAEIGAGQEVARFFFQAGQASMTIAKTISAYDMVYSDEIYGKEASGRYVCESRVKKMLDKEFSLLQRRLQKTRGESAQFFAYANTVATGDQVKKLTHGWMGIRFQRHPGGAFNDIILHVRLLDRYRLQQQEILGVLGVNLVYLAYFLIDHPEQIVSCLVDQTKKGQVSIDLIRFEGPDLTHINSHLVNLELVRRGLCEATLLGPNQEILSITDTLFAHPLIVQRSTFRPVTNTHLQVQELAVQQFTKEFPKTNHPPLSLYEITMKSASPGDEISEQDYLERARAIGSVGGYTLISNFYLHYELKRFLRQYTSAPLALLLGAAHLDRVYMDEYYKILEGGLVEALSKFFDKDTRMYIYPHRTEKGELNIQNFVPPEKYKHIFRHYLDSGMIHDLEGTDQIKELVHSDQIRKWIQEKNPKWESQVPPAVKDLIKNKKLIALLG